MRFPGGSAGDARFDERFQFPARFAQEKQARCNAPSTGRVCRTCTMGAAGVDIG